MNVSFLYLIFLIVLWVFFVFSLSILVLFNFVVSVCFCLNSLFTIVYMYLCFTFIISCDYLMYFISLITCITSWDINDCSPYLCSWYEHLSASFHLLIVWRIGLGLVLEYLGLWLNSIYWLVGLVHIWTSDVYGSCILILRH